MKRNVFATLIALTLLLSAVMIGVFAMPVSATTDSSGNYEYTRDYSGGVSIIRYYGNETVVTIPSYIDGYKVTSITGRYNTHHTFYIGAFDNNDRITEVIIPDSVTTIGHNAFYHCDGLTNVTIPDSVISIEYDAFYDCDGLTEITIPDSVTYIGYNAFRSCYNLNNITISRSIATIGSSAFYGTGYYNNSENWEKGLLYIDDCLVEVKECTGSLTVKSETRAIADLAFSKCTGLTSLTMPAVGQRLSRLFSSTPTSLISVTINGGKTICGSAFYGCKNLTSITLSKSITSIGDNAFFGCTSLTSVTIPDSVTTIGEEAFADCTKLSKVTFGKKIKTIGDGAFYNCTSLTSVTIPDSVTTIGEEAFADCTKLSKVTFGKKVKTIENSAFYNCDGLTSVTIPDSVTTIGMRAFYSCTSLTSVTIGKGITEMGREAFCYCNNLNSVYISDLTAWCKITFNRDNTTSSAGAQSNPLGNGANLYLNGKKVSNLKLPDNLTSVKMYAFYGCKSITSVTMGDKLKSIGRGAFESCDNLTSVTLGKGITTIGRCAFKECSKLAKFTMNNKIKTIQEGAFYFCDKLTTLVLPDSVTSVSGYLPAGLKSLAIGKGVTYIPKGALSSLDNLQSLTIPFVGKELNGTEYTHFAYIFGESQPYNSWYEATCVPKSLKTVTVTGGILVDNYAFYKCSYIENIYIRNGVKELGNSVFSRCLNLKTVSYADSVKRIGWDTYDYCPSLEMVYCTANSAAEDDAKYYEVPYRALDTVKLSKTSYTYNGKTQKPSVVVKDTQGKTISSSHYTVTWPSASKELGTYKVKITFKGYFNGTKTLTYKINPISISKCKVSLSTTAYTYNGSVKKPNVTIKDSQGKKISSSNYTVTYASGRKNVGTYKVTIKMKGKYSGTKTLTFKINPTKTTVKSLTAGKKSLKVAITKKTTQVTGYEVQYSTSKSFKTYKTKTLTSYKKTSLTLSGLSAKKTYYVRVRTYKTVNGKKYYSGWSTIKYKKTK